MKKTILITGSTDGIGLLTAQNLAAQGHSVILHGRSKSKLESAAAQIGGQLETHVADLGVLDDVQALADNLLQHHHRLDVLINNAGVLSAAKLKTPQGWDLRFVVNTLAPYLLTRRLLPIIPTDGRIINLSSAAQAPFDPDVMTGKIDLADDLAVYAQSKLGITIWTQELAKELPEGPVVVAVNPGSLLASKMVKEGFGVAGNDLQIGADILIKACLDDSFSDATGKYFDNDTMQFSPPHTAAQDASHRQVVMRTIEQALA